jgi:fermentation-respiration switch protein FrsA (DUF1100 family)
VRTLLAALALVAGILLAILALFWFTQERLLYFPSRMITGSPADAGLPYDEVSIVSADSIRLHGWFVPAPSARLTVLFCHGNGGNVSILTGTAAVFHRLGCNILLFDYRGYGRSEGTPGEEGTYADALAAWEHLTVTRGIPGDQVVVVGRSLGGAVAAWLAGRVQPAGLVLEAAFTSVPDMAAELYPWLPTSVLTRFRYDTRAAVAGVRAPLLVVHPRNDDVVPFSHGLALYHAANDPKRFIELEGGHNDAFGWTQERYITGLGRFFDEIRPGAGPPAGQGH